MKRTRFVLLLVVGMLAALLPMGTVGAADGVCDEPYTPIYEIQGDGFSSPLLPAPLQFLSYEGSFTASGGVADGMVSEDIGVSESTSTPLGYSLQLTGAGSAYGDFSWAPAAAQTFGTVNTGQTFSGSGDVPFINEIHYDNAGTDAGEAIEIAGPAGFDLTGWSVVLYNGNGGSTYSSISLSGIIPDQQAGFGTLLFLKPGIQNGSPDGLALVTSAVVTTQGIVTADFQMSSELSGFFVQDVEGDSNPSTSDGVFVYHRDSWGFDVSVGEVVRFTAEVTEYEGLTELTNVADLTVCGVGKVKPTKVFLPVSSMADWESVEGMLVDMPQKLYVSGNYTQGRYGEVDLSFNWPLDNPTNVVLPGVAAIELQAANDLNRIQLEDGSTWQNPPWLPYFYDEDGYRTLRTGDTTKKKLTGAIGQYGVYELHPTVPVEFQKKNPRPDGPPDVKGDITVASFNVLNFFTTIDGSGKICGPGGDQGCRGADSVTEYDRQLAKLLVALAGLDADVIGLQEVENDPLHVPIETLVAALNDIEGAGTWAWVGELDHYNNYVIRNEIIYRTAAVTPVGGPLTIADDAFDGPHPDSTRVDTLGRPPVAQTFEADGEIFTVVVNHLKSKSCPGFGGNGGLDDDQLDGQGCFNEQRVLQAERVVEFVEYLQEQTSDPDVLVVGDLNSYAMEDPVKVFTDAGLAELIDRFNGPGWKKGAYSYNYFSQSGYLDHALATPSMASQIEGASFWHINADEPSALDYNTFNQSELYGANEFRSSDHDPVLVGLRLK